MDSLLIQSSTHDYEVVIEEGIRHRLNDLLPKKYRNILIITDDQVESYYANDVGNALNKYRNVHTSIVPAGEVSKSMVCYENLLNACVEAQLDRQSLIIALGGGMVGDLAGFVASTYLRGIDFLQMPTTILAHDSSVGGKVAINHTQGKNLIGAFHNPVLVVYDVETLATLPASEVRSGYGEVVKHALLSDPEWLTKLFLTRLRSLTNEQLSEDLMKGIRVKANIVEKDEREMGVRKHLNLGHTLAHAIEAESGYGEITHGEAVTIGILFALQLSQKQLGSCLPVKDYVNWMKKNDFPIAPLRRLDPYQLVERMKWDKKTVNQSINFVLLTEIGSPCVEKVQNQDIIDALEIFFSEVEDW